MWWKIVSIPRGEKTPVDQAHHPSIGLAANQSAGGLNHARDGGLFISERTPERFAETLGHLIALERWWRQTEADHHDAGESTCRQIDRLRKQSAKYCETDN